MIGWKFDEEEMNPYQLRVTQIIIYFLISTDISSKTTCSALIAPGVT